MAGLVPAIPIPLHGVRIIEMPGTRPGMTSSPRKRMLPVVFRVVGALRPAGPAAPLPMPRAHVGPVADAEKQGAVRSVGVFVHLARRMHDKCAGLDLDRLPRRTHHAAALEAEIDFGRAGVTVIGADLAGLQQATVTSPSSTRPRIFSTCFLRSYTASSGRLKTCIVPPCLRLTSHLAPGRAGGGQWRVARMRQAPRESEYVRL